MDTLNTLYLQDCNQYLQDKNLYRAFKNNDAAQLAKVFSCLESIFKKPFLQKVIYPACLLPSETFINLADDSFKQTLVLFGEQIRRQKVLPEKGKCGKFLFVLFKTTYHLNIIKKLNFPDIVNELTTLLLQATGNFKDLITWYYFDKFSLLQISAITGDTQEFIARGLWNCHNILRGKVKNIFWLPNDTITTEPQFLYLLDYFENNLVDEAGIQSAGQLKEDNLTIQKSFVLELFLRYSLPQPSPLKEANRAIPGAALSADQFISIVQRSFETYPSNKNIPKTKS